MPQKQDQLPRDRAEFLCDTAGSILSIRIRGEIDHHTAAAIRQGIDATLFEKRPKTLILDLSAVGFMDSSGLGLIMGRYSVMKELGGEMTVWNPSPETRAILTLAGMERLVKIAYPQGEEPTADGEASGHGQPSPSGTPRKPPHQRVTATPPTPRTSPRNPRNPRNPRKRGKNGLVYETDPRKEKNA